MIKRCEHASSFQFAGFAVALLQSFLRNSDPDEPNGSGIVPLTIDDLPALRLQSHSRLNPDEALRCLTTLPGLSQWHPLSGEYVLVAPWRHRTDIVSLREVSAFHHESSLVSAVFRSAIDQGRSACITAETYEKRRPIFYSRNGMELFETIIAYHHNRIDGFLDAIESPTQKFVPVTLDDPELLQQVMDTDRAAFGWLWHNSVGEFEWWMHQHNVEVWAGVIDGRVASYYGTTYFHAMGHLDRIGVHPDFQGKRFGTETLTVALQRMAQMGLPRAALSTQIGNVASKHLYESIGFKRSEREDYQMYGTIFPAAPDEWKQQ